ncbi:MAG: hypothetical protein ABIK77_04745 [candidate division WOR-3 bacterium]|uniref:Uncharacterized protein n=1 Tax=candidate division WOR-3 bacterium TaxID=2052148 RepID=A0A7C4S1E3_UNCW3
MFKIGALILGHLLVVIGSFLLTWGIFLLPKSEPTFLGILTSPLFGGLILIFGGICAFRNVRCKSLHKQKSSDKEKD